MDSSLLITYIKEGPGGEVPCARWAPRLVGEHEGELHLEME